MKNLFFAIFLILMISEISASCNSTQININSANLTELDKLSGVGLSIAQNIINSRPFYSLDDLLNVSGIAEKKLATIKSQSLACVENEAIPIEQQPAANQQTTIQNGSIEETTQEEPTNVPLLSPPIQKDESPKTVQAMEPIKLDTQNIKTNNENGNYAMYGFIGFCILIAVLFILNFRHRRKEENNEFR